MPASQPLHLQSLRHTVSVATGFWAACLVLTGMEATAGANFVPALLFLVSIPVLVGFLTWANSGFLAAGRGACAVVMLGVVVLLSASVIILFGLLASAGLTTLMASV